MRLIIPHAYNVKGGVERTTVLLIRELAKIIDQVIFVLPDSQIPYFQGILLPSDRLAYESFSWQRSECTFKRRFYEFTYRILLIIHKWLHIPFAKRWLDSVGSAKNELRLRHLIEKYRATHCLYMIAAGQKAPKIKIPLAVVLYDIFWHCAPERFPASLVRERDANLKEWLAAADAAFSISKFTRDMALDVFPDFKEKIKVIPLGLGEKEFNNIDRQNAALPQNAVPFFFFPAGSIAMHKNIYTLFAAAAKLAEKGLPFQLLITARDIGRLAGHLHSGRRQDEKARLFYQENRSLLEKHIRLKEFCTREELEDIYSNCSCIVLPSILESSSLWPFIEAVERGIPVICSDIEEIKEYIELYQCLDTVKTFSSLDAQALAGRLEDFILHPIARIQAQEVKKRFSHWTARDMAGEYVKSLAQSA